MDSILSSRLDDDEITAQRRSPMAGRREADHEQPRMPSWRELAAIVGLVSMVYTIGFNWKEITTVRGDLERQILKNASEHDGFMLREVSNFQYLEIQRQLSEMQRLLEKADRKR